MEFALGYYWSYLNLSVLRYEVVESAKITRRILHATSRTLSPQRKLLGFEASNNSALRSPRILLYASKPLARAKG